MIFDPTVQCPATAIEQLSGESLRIYLALKLFIEKGGNQVVSAEKIATTLNLDTVIVKLGLAHLCIKGWLTIELKTIAAFFNDELLLSKPWVVNAENELTLPSAELLLDAKSTSIELLEGYLTELYDKHACQIIIKTISSDAKILINFIEIKSKKSN